MASFAHVNGLRLHYLDGLSTERIGELYGAHRVTVARWLASARASLLDETRKRLAERLGVPATKVDSLIRILWSKLDVSLSRELRARNG